MNAPQRRRRRKTVEPVASELKKGDTIATKKKDLRGVQRDTAGTGYYTISQVAAIIERTPATIRKWMRFEESPKPKTTIHMPNNPYPVRLWDEEDIGILLQWREAMEVAKHRRKFGGPLGNEPRKYPKKTRRRIAGEPFYAGQDVEVPDNPFIGTEMTRRPNQETFAEYWARVRGQEVEEVEHDTGFSTVAVKRIKRKTGPVEQSDGTIRPRVAGERKMTERRKRSKA